MPADSRWVVTTTVVFLLAVATIPTNADPDLWGHTRFGLDVLQTGALPDVDTYSFTQDRPLLYHEWLGAVLIAAGYHLGDTAGLVGLKVFIVGATWAIFYSALRGTHPIVAAAVWLLAAWNALPITLTLRPQLWTLLALIALVRLLQVHKLGWVPLLFVPWANLHGGWVMGMGVLAVWCATSALDGLWRTRRVQWPFVVVPVIAVSLTLLTPYGWTLWRFVVETVSFTRADITEWQPLATTPAYTWIPIAITVALFVTACIDRRTRLSWPWLAVCVVLGYASLRMARVAPVAMPAVLLIIAPALSFRWPRERWTLSAPSRAAAVLTLIPLALVGGVAAWLMRPAVSCVPVNGDWRPDAAAISVLQQNRAMGRLVTWFDWGEYAYWHLSPALRVSMDGRRETIYSERILAVHRAIYANEQAGHQWLSAQRPEYVWLPANHQARRVWLEQHS